jgi:hypothetical protein
MNDGDCGCDGDDGDHGVDAKKDAIKDALQRARAVAAAKAKIENAHGVPTQVAGVGPFGLPSGVRVLGVNVPTIAILAVAAVLVLTGTALVVHFVRRG